MSGQTEPAATSRDMEAPSNERLKGDKESGDPTDATTKKLSLFDLPQELQDIIFDYAYPEVDSLKLISRQDWDDREFHSRMEDQVHAIRPYPSPKVCEMMVSKHFFEAAIRAWIGNQWIDFASPFIFGRRGGRGKPTDESLFCKWGSKILWEGPSCGKIMEEYVYLKKLKLTVWVDKFSAPGAGYPWEVLFSDDDIRATKAYRKATRLRGLTSLEVMPREEYRMSTQESKQSIWRTNVQRFEDLVKPIVFAQKEARKEKQITLDSTLEDLMALMETLRADAMPDLQDTVRTGSSVMTRQDFSANQQAPSTQVGVGSISHVGKAALEAPLPGYPRLDDYLARVRERAEAREQRALRNSATIVPNPEGSSKKDLQTALLAQLANYPGQNGSMHPDDDDLDMKEGMIAFFTEDPKRILDWALAGKDSVAGTGHNHPTQISIDKEAQSDTDGGASVASRPDISDQSPKQPTADAELIGTVTDESIEEVLLARLRKNVGPPMARNKINIPESNEEALKLLVEDPSGFLDAVHELKKAAAARMSTDAQLSRIFSSIQELQADPTSVIEILPRPRRIRRSGRKSGGEPPESEQESRSPQRDRDSKQMAEEILNFIKEQSTTKCQAMADLNDLRKTSSRKEKEMQQDLEDLEGVEEELEESQEYAEKLEEDTNRKQKILDVVFVLGIAALCFFLTMLVAPPCVQEKLWTL